MKIVRSKFTTLPVIVALHYTNIKEKSNPCNKLTQIAMQRWANVGNGRHGRSRRFNVEPTLGFRHTVHVGYWLGIRRQADVGIWSGKCRRRSTLARRRAIVTDTRWIMVGYTTVCRRRTVGQA